MGKFNQTPNDHLFRAHSMLLLQTEWLETLLFCELEVNVQFDQTAVYRSPPCIATYPWPVKMQTLQSPSLLAHPAPSLMGPE